MEHHLGEHRFIKLDHHGAAGEQVGRFARVLGPQVVPAGLQRVVEHPLAVLRGQPVQVPAA